MLSIRRVTKSFPQLEIYEELDGKEDVETIEAWNGFQLIKVIPGKAILKAFREVVYDLKNTHLEERETGNLLR